MTGETMLMEFRKSWKGFLIFFLVVGVIAGGIVQLYPVVLEAFEEDVEELEGGENVDLEIRNENIYISWADVEGAQYYRVIEDRNPYMATSWELDNTTDNYITISDDGEDSENRYFAVIAVIGVMEDPKMIPLGMASTVEPKTPIEEMMETAVFQMFTAGRADVRMDEIEGFLSIELYSWWILLVGLYLAYISVKSISEDFEERRMDLIFSTPTSRRQYLVEKISSLSIFTFVLLALTSLLMALSAYSIGELGSIGFYSLFLSIITSWPMFLVILGTAVFFSVLFKKSQVAVGITFVAILIQYSLHLAGNMMEGLEFLKPYTIATYWDYNSVLLDGVVSGGDFLLLTAVAIVIFGGSIAIFDRTDIPG